MSLYLGENLISGVATPIQGARNIGEIIQSTLPLFDAGLHLLDGSLIDGSGIYSDFVDYIHNLFLSNYVNLWKCSSSQTEEIVWVRDNDITENTIIYSDTKGTVYQKEDYPKYVVHDNDIMYATMEGVYYSIRRSSNTIPINMFTTEEEWQQSVTTYGVCGKFVYNIVNNTVRLPKITGFIEGTTSLTALGDLIEAGLPDHTHTVPAPNSYTGSGSGYSQWYGQGTKTFTSSAASDSNSIYGNSDTVQPQSIKVFYYIVIATSTKTDIEVDIDEIAKDLNNKANNADVVHKTSDETINGTKTFSNSPIVPTPAVSSNTTVPATTAYINNKFILVSALPASPDANTFYFIPE